MSLEEARNIVNEQKKVHRENVMIMNRRIAEGNGNTAMMEQRTADLYVIDVLDIVLGKIGMAELITGE